MTKAASSEILFYVVYYNVRGSCISQENQVGYVDGGGSFLIRKTFFILTLVALSGSG